MRARRVVRAELAQRPPMPDGTVEIAVYFTDGPENLYQIDQWFEPLRRLHERHHVTVLVAQLGGHPRAAAQRTRCRSHHAPNIDEVEAFIGRQRIRAMLYVNQNQANFSAMRFADPAHVFICHGESDKDYMSSNQLKAYDRVFIAGTAARERIMRKLIGFDESAARSRSAAPRSTSTSPARRSPATAAPWCCSPPPGRATARRCGTPRSARTDRRWRARWSPPAGTG